MPILFMKLSFPVKRHVIPYKLNLKTLKTVFSYIAPAEVTTTHEAVSNKKTTQSPQAVIVTLPLPITQKYMFRTLSNYYSGAIEGVIVFLVLKNGQRR